MSQEDTPVWMSFMRTYRNSYSSFAYDLPVGNGVQNERNASNKWGRMYAELTKKRVDAVGFADSFTDVIEVKPRANARAVGQVLQYLDLFKLTYPQYVDARAVLLCYAIMPEDLAFAEKMGVKVITVKPY